MNIKRRSKKFSDFSMTFNRNPMTGDIITLSGHLAIKRSVINLIMTQFHERFYQVDLGTSVRKKLFESDTVSIRMDVESDIRRVIELYEPRVKINEVNTRFNDNELIINLEYTIISENIIDKTKVVYKFPVLNE